MKKLIGLIMLIAFMVSGSYAQTMFFGSGASGADVVIPNNSGSISAENVLISVETNATVTVWRGSAYSSITNEAAYTGTSLILNTDSTNTVGGITITTGDAVIIGNQLRTISGVAVVAGGLSTTLTVASATVAPGQAVYICDGDNKVSLAARTTWGGTPIPFLFRGYNQAPAAISVPSTAGATMVSGQASSR